MTVSVIIVVMSIFIVLSVLLGALIYKPVSVYKNSPEQRNPMEGKKVVFIEEKDGIENADGIAGKLVVIGDSEKKKGFYCNYVKRILDILLSFLGLTILAPVFLTVSLAVYINDPGPVFFTQKRVGEDKRYFKLHKFRSMKMLTPKDVPTHMLENPDNYITKVGKFIRAHSLDELPQIWDIFIGNMSIVGPRPALWNQDLLVAEREKYEANNVKPGLTGWAQINGRDELSISEKARLDGEYVKNMSFWLDLRCFLRTVHVVRSDDSVVEGKRRK